MPAGDQQDNAKASGTIAMSPRRFAVCSLGTSAIESALVLPGFILALIAVLQFGLFHLQQETLNNKLYDLASSRLQTVIGMNKADLTKQICDSLSFAKNCSSTLILELGPIEKYATGAPAVTGAIFEQGKLGDVMMLRAQVKAMNVLPGVDNLDLKGAAIFARTL